MIWLAPALAATPVVDGTRLLALSTAEVVGMGGAGIGFATGASGMFFQPGAASNRRFEARSAFGVSLAFNQLGIGPATPVDLGNVGVDGTWQGGMTNLGAAVTWRNAGIGAVFGSLEYAGNDGHVVMSEGHVGGGGAVWDGHVMFGAGWRLLSLEAELDGKRAVYTGQGLETGIALNRLWAGWNLGVVMRSPVVAERSQGGLDLGLGGVSVPWQLALGVAWFEPRIRPRPVRIAADVVIDGVVPGGLSLESLLAREPLERGRQVSVTPRLGVEGTAWPERLRLRGGAYLEPGRVDGALPRFHGTAGLELRLFHFDLFNLLQGDLSWEIAADVAPRYTNFAYLGIGFWQRGVTGIGWDRPEG